MKIAATKDFGTSFSTQKKPLLPLVPEPTPINKKEDLVQIDLFSDPADHNSTKVKFAFKILDGNMEAPREVIQWRRNVDRALVGLDLTTGTSQHQMVQQFCRGSGLSTYNTAVTGLCAIKKATAVLVAQRAVDADDGTDAVRLAGLQATLTTAEGRDQAWFLAQADGNTVIGQAMQELLTALLPNKILQRVKRYLRREARKPVDMGVKTYLMHLMRINAEEIPRCPPSYDIAQCLSEDELVDILLFGTPKSWQREMDRQGFDPLAKTPAEVVAFMERIEMSEDFDADKKVVKVNNQKTNNNKKKNTSTGSGGSKYCMLHGNCSHSTEECNTLKAEAKKLKGNSYGNNSSNGRSKNKTWTKKGQQESEKSQKELAAFVKKSVKQGIKKELHSIQKKRKSDSDDEIDLHALELELDEFNYEDMDKMDIKDDAKEDGEVDSISISTEIST